MGYRGGAYLVSMAGAFALGVLLMYLSSLKLALFIMAVLLFAVCRMFMHYR